MTSQGAPPELPYVIVQTQQNQGAEETTLFKNQKVPKILGSIQIVAGVLCIAINSFKIHTQDEYSVVGYGIWGGVLASTDLRHTSLYRIIQFISQN